MLRFTVAMTACSLCVSNVGLRMKGRNASIFYDGGGSILDRVLLFLWMVIGAWEIFAWKSLKLKGRR